LWPPWATRSATRVETGRRLPARYDVPVGPQHLHPDFIILHPQRELFVLEVKDWRLDTIQSVTRDEFAIATPNGIKQVKNPLRQARDYALAICSLLEKDAALVQPDGRCYQGKLLCPYAYDVVLPFFTRRMFDSEPALAEVIDPHLVICRDEMTENYGPGYFQERLWSLATHSLSQRQRKGLGLSSLRRRMRST